MRGPDAALLKGRAKVALSQVKVLHLTNASLDCLHQLDVCTELEALYADENHINNIEGVGRLKKLWRIDLSGNFLHQYDTLASFQYLGFLSLERNQLEFVELVPLRDLHLIELRLYDGNPALWKSGTVVEYRMKTVALLPSIWILDGHFITTKERLTAIESCEEFVKSILSQKQLTLSFGSCTNLWTEPDHRHPNVRRMIQLLGQQPVRHQDLTDKYRLRAVCQFYTESCTLHNSYIHFAPSKHAGNARPLPTLHLDALLWRKITSQQERLEVAVLLASFLEFRVPKQLVKEALVISLISHDSILNGSTIEDLVALQPFGLAVVVMELRQDAMSSLEGAADIWESIPIVLRSLLPAEQLNQASAATEQGEAQPFPVAVQSLGADEITGQTPTTEVQDSSFLTITTIDFESVDSSPFSDQVVTDVQQEEDKGVVEQMSNSKQQQEQERMASLVRTRHRMALSLLSKASSFPSALISKSNLNLNSVPGSRNTSLTQKLISELKPLMKAAEVTSLMTLQRVQDDNMLSMWHPSPWLSTSLATTHSEIPIGSISKLPWNAKGPNRNFYERPWASPSRTSTPSTPVPFRDQKALEEERGNDSLTKRKPKQGDFIEIQPKQYLRVKSFNQETSLLIAAPLKESSDPIIFQAQLVTIALHQLARVSGNMWRLTFDISKEKVDEIIQKIRHSATFNPQRAVGALHRGSHGFHRHGMSRNQGFPNHFLTPQDLKAMEQAAVLSAATGSTDSPLVSPLSTQAQPIEVFASNDTLDSNFVLASPSLITLQNLKQLKIAMTTSTTTASNGASSSVWSPIKTAPFKMVTPSPAITGSSTSKQTSPPKFIGSKQLQEPTVDDSRDPSLVIQEKKEELKLSSPTPRDKLIELDDWSIIQKEMQLILGKESDHQKEDIDETDVLCFLTSSVYDFVKRPSNGDGDEEKAEDMEVYTQQTPTTSTLRSSSSVPSLLRSGHSKSSNMISCSPLTKINPSKSATKAWHTVSTKPQFLVASSSESTLGKGHLNQKKTTNRSSNSFESSDTSAAAASLCTSSIGGRQEKNHHLILPTLFSNPK